MIFDFKVNFCFSYDNICTFPSKNQNTTKNQTLNKNLLSHKLGKCGESGGEKSHRFNEEGNNLFSHIPDVFQQSGQIYTLS